MRDDHPMFCNSLKNKAAIILLNNINYSCVFCLTIVCCWRAAAAPPPSRHCRPHHCHWTAWLPGTSAGQQPHPPPVVIIIVARPLAGVRLDSGAAGRGDCDGRGRAGWRRRWPEVYYHTTVARSLARVSTTALLTAAIEMAMVARSDGSV